MSGKTCKQRHDSCALPALSCLLLREDADALARLLCGCERLILTMLRLAVLLCAAPAAAQVVRVSVADTAPLQTLDALYQGYNLDSGSLYNGIALEDPVLMQLTRNLGPAQLRIGGSASDSAWYVPDAPDGAPQGPTPDPLATTSHRRRRQ